MGGTRIESPYACFDAMGRPQSEKAPRQWWWVMDDLEPMYVAAGTSLPMGVGRKIFALIGLALGALAPLVVASARTLSEADFFTSGNANAVLSDDVKEAAHEIFSDFVLAHAPTAKPKVDPFLQLSAVGIDGGVLREAADDLDLDMAHFEDFDLGGIDFSGIDSKERTCLAEAIYYEARNQSVAGQMAVADVVMNRVASSRFPNTVCGVVYEGSHRVTGCQFSFTCDGSMDKRVERSAMERSQILAMTVMGGFRLALSQNATNYHATYVDPYWALTLDKTVKIDDHVFYKRGQKFTRYLKRRSS